MTNFLHRISRRALLPALGLALTIGAAGLTAPAAHAEQNGGGVSPQKTCTIPGSNLQYLPGEKATFSLNGQPAKEHTCQKDGTWTALRRPPLSRFPMVMPTGGVYMAP